MSEQLTHIYLTPVSADRADEFERFLLEVVPPAVAAQRLGLTGRWRLLRPSQAASADGTVLTYAFLFDGGDLDEDWDLSKLLPLHYGQEEAEQLLQGWTAMFARYRRWITAMGKPDEDIARPGWTLTTVAPAQ
jgi:hypothetical protein